MKRLLLFELLVAATLFNSCSKDSGSTTTLPQEPSLKVKTLTEEVTANTLHFLLTSTFSYDAQDRVIKVQNDSGYTNFTYNGNVIKKDSHPATQPAQHTTYYLNTMSLLDSVVSYYDGVDFMFYSNYLYNSNHQLIKIIYKSVYDWYTSTDSAMYEYNTGGDISKITQDDNVNSYEYYDKPNFQNSVSMLNPGLAPNPHLVKTSWFSFNGGMATTTSYEFDFDGDGRIVTITEQTSGNYPETYIANYTYY